LGESEETEYKTGLSEIAKVSPDGHAVYLLFVESTELSKSTSTPFPLHSASKVPSASSSPLGTRPRP
jgi:hypothetical protein